ncbi:MAG: hypothetical protein A3I44_00025 [Candidatus Sungbacteria bacterium RIFCSPLOWO2_02_FULL_51_17]|uniref:Pilus assembly protein PilO n=1 Tax=Candidatus Sungbacteria bacterium RIFCSPHIGHO2_02_FULL_51_29 TaxID=1802273 RepID=A0A1G2KQR5_9BACT|nr:MAG: hypothetical protein A2676_05460 [Candidatus Sungbacteria bacterium RIFCSPHIGHO2_01_FULL_51_22]OHA01765.1 MAG: hypothetical protein A3C16_02665 [Candidatus Sungbacteria bacterium RIFCSPHIGHO2_02_FULL_51_29]OHA07959.1 MAG: hypothetical protein A3B29_04155 [Candidatus Sungbacteria bacterium RIFCSPLOWO2_01_FULL_51_34]OHA11543.1 MAG: hypothetical protein A3I44_00025 [Candidatus Sungbacteria bacterium RIFCSPLOWO2_02_FULL_51_17]
MIIMIIDVSPKIAYATTAAASIMCVALGAAGIYALLISYVLRESAAISAIQSQIAMLEAKKSQAKDKEDDLASARESMRLLRSVFLDPADPLPFLELLEDEANRAGVLMSIMLGELRQGSAPAQEFLITASGSYVNVRAFLAMMELLPFEVSVRNAKLQKNQVGFAADVPQEIRLSLMVHVAVER